MVVLRTEPRLLACKACPLIYLPSPFRTLLHADSCLNTFIPLLCFPFWFLFPPPPPPPGSEQSFLLALHSGIIPGGGSVDYMGNWALNMLDTFYLLYYIALGSPLCFSMPSFTVLLKSHFPYEILLDELQFNITSWCTCHLGFHYSHT